MVMRLMTGLGVFAAAVSLGPMVQAADVVIHTGGANGAYHSGFCPALGEELEKKGYSSTCRTSEGTIANLEEVARDPRDFAYGQLDAVALKGSARGADGEITIVRKDDARECLFAVSSAKGIDSYGEIAVRADQLKFVLPPKGSGSATTFEYLQKIDPYGVGRGTQVSHARDTDAAIEAALASEDTVTLFVQFPDPENARFKAIQQGGGHIVPVIDRTILDQTMDGERVYFAQETQVANAGWLRSGPKVVTACTPMVLFTGDLAAIEDKTERDRHEQLVAAIEGLQADTVLPRQSLFAKVIRRTRELSSQGASKFVEFSEQARERASPIFEQAREAARRAVDAAKPRDGQDAPQ